MVDAMDGSEGHGSNLAVDHGGDELLLSWRRKTESERGQTRLGETLTQMRGVQWCIRWRRGGLKDDEIDDDVLRLRRRLEFDSSD